MTNYQYSLLNGDGTVTTTLIVNPAIPTAQSVTLCSGQSITVGSNTYNTNGTSIAGETNQSFAPSSNRQYAVVITQGQCTVTSACIAVISLDVHADLEQSVNVFPNPCTNQITIQLSQTSEVVITNSIGQVIYNRELDAGQQQMDLSNQPSGMYVIQIISGDQIQTLQLIKE